MYFNVSFPTSCGTIALMVLDQFPEICGPMCGPQISENWPRTIRATVPQLSPLLHVPYLFQSMHVVHQSEKRFYQQTWNKILII